MREVDWVRGDGESQAPQENTTHSCWSDIEDNKIFQEKTESGVEYLSEYFLMSLPAVVNYYGYFSSKCVFVLKLRW